jgi:hypothetical protein
MQIPPARPALRIDVHCIEGLTRLDDKTLQHKDEF